MFWPVDGIFSPNTLPSGVSERLSDRAAIAFSQWLKDSIGSMGKLETPPKNGARKSVGWQAENDAPPESEFDHLARLPIWFVCPSF